jgi:prepilin-type N-terminal cleavage/methylation domain-containing protein
MKHNFPGFTLIELIIATMIAGVLSGILLTALSQSARVQSSVDTTIDLSERIGITVGQLEKDLAGAFVPTSAVAEAMADKAAEEKKDEVQKADKKNEAAQPKDEKSTQKKEPKPIEKIFHSTNKDGMLDTLTFVTNNPLVVFVGKDVGTVKPKVVRVQYTLKPDPENKGSFILFRQESNELDLAEYKNVRPYELMGGVKKLSVSYTARIEKKEDKKASQAQAAAGKEKAAESKKKQYEYKVQPEWVSEQKKDASAQAPANKKEDKEPEFPRIPHSVEFKMTLWDKQNKKDKEFTFVCAIPVDSIEAQQKDKQQPEPSAAPEEKPADAKNQGQQGQKVARGGHVVQTDEIVVYNGIEAVANALDSLKKLLGHA